MLTKLGVKRGMVVYGQDKLDEISMSAPTSVCEFEGDEFKLYRVQPEDFGVERCQKADLVGGDPAENARITREILSGKPGPKRDVVTLNAGAAFYIANKVSSWQDGVELARQLIDDGVAMNVLDRFVEESKK